MRPSDKITGGLKGRVEILANGKDLVFAGRNQITDFGHEEFIRLLLAGNLDALVWQISVGEGGDCAILPPHNPTGARVPPDPSEDEIRKLIGTVDVSTITRGGAGEVIYSALARREQVNSPNINELALLTRDGQMIAHYVTDPEMTGEAQKKPKTDLMFWIIRWTVEYTGA
jgi:hypothetical protein